MIPNSAIKKDVQPALPLRFLSPVPAKKSCSTIKSSNGKSFSSGLVSYLENNHGAGDKCSYQVQSVLNDPSLILANQSPISPSTSSRCSSNKALEEAPISSKQTTTSTKKTKKKKAKSLTSVKKSPACPKLEDPVDLSKSKSNNKKKGSDKEASERTPKKTKSTKKPSSRKRGKAESTLQRTASCPGMQGSSLRRLSKLQRLKEEREARENGESTQSEKPQVEEKRSKTVNRTKSKPGPSKIASCSAMDGSSLRQLNKLQRLKVEREACEKDVSNQSEKPQVEEKRPKTAKKTKSKSGPSKTSSCPALPGSSLRQPSKLQRLKAEREERDKAACASQNAWWDQEGAKVVERLKAEREAREKGLSTQNERPQVEKKRPKTAKKTKSKSGPSKTSSCPAVDGSSLRQLSKLQRLKAEREERDASTCATQNAWWGLEATKVEEEASSGLTKNASWSSTPSLGSQAKTKKKKLAGSSSGTIKKPRSCDSLNSNWTSPLETIDEFQSAKVKTKKSSDRKCVRSKSLHSRPSMVRFPDDRGNVKSRKSFAGSKGMDRKLFLLSSAMDIVSDDIKKQTKKSPRRATPAITNRV